MSIIYQPQLIFNVREAVGGALKDAGLLAIADFVAGTNKPWAYYLGATFGGAALATGIPGAAAILYAIGDSMDFWIFKSPDGSEVRWFLNGVQQTSLDTYAATGVWELVQNVVLASGNVNEIQFINYAASANPSATGIPWLALGDFEIFGDDAVAFGKGSPNMDTIVFYFTDSESSTKRSAVPVAIPSGQSIATIQAYANIAAVRLDRMSGCEIDEAKVELALTLPTKSATPGATEIKDAPLAGILNERGGLISFDTTGPRSESLWVPGVRMTIMSGDAFSLEDAAVSPVVELLTTEVTANSVAIRPVTPYNYQFEVARKGVKSLRRKS